MDDRSMVVDLNHPLARFFLRWEGIIDHLEVKRSDTGGGLYHWGETVADMGPGMQAPLEGRTTDFLDPDFFRREDEADDGLFYDGPRMVAHVDARASEHLSSIYARFLKPGMRVLDIMAGSQSHLPDGLELEVTGLGMNGQELASNSALSQRVVHDLNLNPIGPEGLGRFDAVVCSLSFEYLTRPMEVLGMIRDILRPDGVFLVGLSNRWFPPKVVAGWPDLHDFERPALVLDLAEKVGFIGPAGTVSVRNDWRPFDDRHFLETRGVSDPVHVVWMRTGA